MQPKYVGLTFSMKNDLRAKTHISVLNRLGVCISYDDLMRIATKQANDILEEGDEYATLPYFHKWLLIVQIMDKRTIRNILQIPLYISIQTALLVKTQ